MIELTPMTDKEYDAFYRCAIHDYAQGLVRAGNAHPDPAVQMAVQQCAPVLTDGLASLNQFFYIIREDTADAAHVGYLWWGIREQYGVRTAHLDFIYILEPYRRRGYATRALHLLDELVAKEELDKVRL